MRDFSGDISALRQKLDEASEYLKIDDLRRRQPELETEAARPDLWDDADRAREVTSELSTVQADLEVFDTLVTEIDDAETLNELSREEGDESFETEIESAIAKLGRRFADLELRSLFTGEYDDRDAVCEIHSGEGGTDAQDWAEILLRMYSRWAEGRGFDVEIDEVADGTEAGISKALFTVKGRHAYGMLKAENGVHRLVRISPFNSQGKRQTAFASFITVPGFEDKDDQGIEIDEKKDLRVDVYRSSGAGGQHINKTSSAVRLTHLPTGIVVACQNERSQHQNKDRAMQLLKAKLADLARQERQAETDELKGDQQRVGFGSQIRSYVLHPYQMVKDLRTETEVGNVDGVLDGNLDPFIEAYLRSARDD